MRSIGISFFMEGGEEEVDSRDWPCVPRIGESVRLYGMPDNMTVIEVCWCDHVGGDEAIRDHAAVAVVLRAAA